MSLIREFINRIRAKPPVIQSPYGQVTEVARRQAAENMFEDPGLRYQVEQMIIRECGGDRERGLKECQRRYPEAYGR